MSTETGTTTEPPVDESTQPMAAADPAEAARLKQEALAAAEATQQAVVETEKKKGAARVRKAAKKAQSAALRTQFFVVSEELDTIEVAAKLGLPSHSELNVLNGRYSGNNTVQPGQRLVLPDHYRFVDIDGVVTE